MYQYIQQADEWTDIGITKKCASNDYKFQAIVCHNLAIINSSDMFYNSWLWF